MSGYGKPTSKRNLRDKTLHKKGVDPLPPSVDEWVPGDHPVRFIYSCLDQMELDSFYESYASEGRPPYDPQTMLNILIYAYSKGIRSSRKISRACEDEIPFRWISVD